MSEFVSLMIQVGTFIAIIGGSLIFVIKSFKSGSKDYDKGTILSLQSSISALETERDIFKKQSVAQSEQIKELQNKIEVLEHIVTAKDDIVRIEGILNQFLPLLGDRGMLSLFATNDGEIISKLNYIIKLLDSVEARRTRKP